MAPTGRGCDVVILETCYHGGFKAVTRRQWLQVTGVQGEIVASNWGDSEVKELLLSADDGVNQRFSGTVTASGKASDVGVAIVPNVCE